MSDTGERTGLEINSNFLQTGGLTLYIITKNPSCKLITSSWWAVPRPLCSLLASNVVQSEDFYPAAPAQLADNAGLVSHWKGISSGGNPPKWIVLRRCFGFFFATWRSNTSQLRARQPLQHQYRLQCQF